MHGNRDENPHTFAGRMQMAKDTKQYKSAKDEQPKGPNQGPQNYPFNPKSKGDADDHKPATAPAKRVMPLKRKGC